MITSQEIRCSYDPNDKIARTVRSAGDGQSFIADPLLYTIRFQNTGNDTALNVIIRDTLDENLDLNSLEIIGASHPYEAFLKTDRTLEFRFLKILLPDSTTNEMASHGFVTYRITAKTDVQSPAIIENTAHIYFDYNRPVRTNTAINELVDVGTGVYDEQKLITIVRAFPNPTSGDVMIASSGIMKGPIQYTLYTMHGQALLAGILTEGASQYISLSSFPAGMYVIKASAQSAQQSFLLVKG